MLAERHSAENVQGSVRGGSAQGGAVPPAVPSLPQPGGVSGGVSGKMGLRIVVEKGGCAGMQYEMRFDVSGPEDIVNESEGACVFVDPASARFLGGASLDYCDDLVGTGFRLHNPNAARSCGCGTSFEPLDEPLDEPLEDREAQAKTGEQRPGLAQAGLAQSGLAQSGLAQEREATATAR